MALGAVALGSVSAAFAQSCLGVPLGWFLCIDPDNTDPYTQDFSVGHIAEYVCDDAPLFNIGLGEAGSAAYGGDDNICGEGFSMAVSGSIGFGIGSIGSIHSSRDDFLQLTFGMPIEPANAGGYASIVRGTTRTRFGTTGIDVIRGLSHRYMLANAVVDNVLVELRVDVVGDAARLQWDLTNTTDTAQDIGLWFGNWLTMMSQDGDTRGGPGGTSNGPIYVYTPGNRAPERETRWTRSGNTSIFPKYVNFNWSQDEPYGLRVDNGPSAETDNLATAALDGDATQADEFVLGNQGGRLGDSSSSLLDGYIEQGNFPDSISTGGVNSVEPGKITTDFPFRGNAAYIQKFYPQPRGPGQVRRIVQYFRSTWGQGNYGQRANAVSNYAVVVDLPRIVNFSDGGLNQLTPNPVTARVYVDNVNAYSGAGEEFPLQGVRVKMDLTSLPAARFVGGTDVQTKVLASIAARRMSFVEFQIELSGEAEGILNIPVSVEVDSPTGSGNKNMVVKLQVATTPRLDLIFGPNLVTVPWVFDDTAWTSILGLSQPSQFQAFIWDADQQGYLISTSAQRGQAAWLLIKDEGVTSSPLLLNGNPRSPSDLASGAGTVQLKQGWNLIGNPYQYPIQINELLGAVDIANDPVKTWAQLVSLGLVSGSLAYWDEDSDPPSYKFATAANNGVLEPHRGYWVFVQANGMTLQFPPVFLEGALVNAFAPTIAPSRAWKQTDDQWRLQIVARTREEIDDQNFVGRAADAKSAKVLVAYEPPKTPTQGLAASIASPEPNGTRRAQSLSEKTGKQQWSVLVETKEAGDVTLTWPNMATVPKGQRFRITDVATGTSRDMRRSSGYTFAAEANATRQFTVEAEAGGTSRAVIGNVVVSRPGRDRSAPFTISYTLSANATTTVRILGAGGKEVFTATRGRADRVGENTVSWAMRDNANRAVAPGTYRVEIVAETAEGERVRKVVPVNVVR